MAAPKTQRSRRSGHLHPALFVTVLLVVGAALAGTAAVVGVSTGWIGGKNAQASAPNREGKIPVPVAARTIPAYTKLRRDHLIRPETLEFAVVWLDEDKARASGLILELRSVLNRVLANDKQAGYAFAEDDFLPLGTRPGLTAGIEEGMRGVRIPTDRVLGMHGLRRGDRFDLVAMQKIDEGRKPERSTVVRAQVSADAAVRAAWSASTRVLVHNGKIVEPVSARSQPGGGQRKVEEVLIAIPEQEVSGLTEALAVGAEILCLPRSGLPGADTYMPEPDAARPSNVIEVFSGDERRFTIVPNPDDEPSASMEGNDAQAVGGEPRDEEPLGDE